MPQLNLFPVTDSVTNNNAIDSPFLPIPDCPPAPNHHLGVQYYIPEWDDRIDPGYNFLSDTPSPGRDPSGDIYAHQLYPKPNYDGVLVSKIICDKTKSKRIAIAAQGIHQFIRFSGPIMGDCGAFGYIKEEVPPYNTPEILEYYQTCGFDFGVSIDHLIVGPFAQPGVREQRYALTLSNAREFLEQHRSGGYSFTPIGVVQGWSPQTYASAAQALIAIGYDYLAIGGIARAPTKEILEILQAIRPHLTPTTRLHLFGVGRFHAVPAFRHLGVTSFDSASLLRQAWLGSDSNYHTVSGKKYAAIRIPQVDGLRAKKIISAGAADRSTLQILEQSALQAIREFDTGKLGLESALEALLEYDQWLDTPTGGDATAIALAQAKRRQQHQRLYRELLEEKPWKHCGCTVCQNIGVEVVIFRGNDRNRRRGFHNTYTFYQQLQKVLGKT